MIYGQVVFGIHLYKCLFQIDHFTVVCFVAWPLNESEDVLTLF